MNEWTRIFFREHNGAFDRSQEHTEKPVWLFAQADPAQGVRPGVIYQYANPALEPREFFFEASGEEFSPSHWLDRAAGSKPPQPPGASFLVCTDGEPHDWKVRPTRNDDGSETGGEMTICTQCQAIGDSSGSV